jgi:hypothetical protein
MGRLEEIVERNKHPRRHRKGSFPLGIGVAVFVLIILILMIFTDLGEDPTYKATDAPVSPSQTEKRVPGIYLGAPKKRGPAPPVAPPAAP